MNILFIGDISGKIGRQAVAKLLPKIKKENKLDLVIANAENAAHGSGVTEATLKELQKSGVDCFTLGDHAFKRIKQAQECYDKFPIVRPANWPKGVPGVGHRIVDVKNKKILLINLIGRVGMAMDFDCPFRKIDEILANPNLAKEKFSAIIIDIHAETTSEKVSLKHYIDGRATALLGTHTHIMTADQEITDQNMAYITDVGMCGAADHSLGIDKEDIIKTFLTQVKYPHVIPEKGRAQLNGVLIKVSPKNIKAKSIKPITKFIEIK